MAKMTKNQLIDAIAEGTQVSKRDVKAVIEQMTTVGYKELNESGEFVIPGFKMSVVNKPATEARSDVGLRRKRFDHGLLRCLESERRPALGSSAMAALDAT